MPDGACQHPWSLNKNMSDWAKSESGKVNMQNDMLSKTVRSRAWACYGQQGCIRGALVLTAWYHWDALASRLGAWRLGLRPWSWQGSLLLLDGLLLDYHGALHRSSAGVAANGLLIRFLRVTVARGAALRSVELAVV